VSPWKRVLRVLSSMQVTMVCLLLLMAVVLLCTFDQVRLGAFAAVAKDIRSWALLWRPHPGGPAVPLFPGGALLGSVLALNLAAALAARISPAKRPGLWLAHAGVLLLVLGEFAAGLFAVESRMALREGQTLDFTESSRRSELAVISLSDPRYDEVFSVREEALVRRGTLSHPAWPFSLKVREYHPNAVLEGGRARGVPRVSSDEEADQPAALIEAEEGGRSLGSWLLSRAEPAQGRFSAGGREYLLSLRAERHPLPFTLTLEDFKREVYPGTTIPKSFSSRVRLKDAAGGEDRGAIISMNNPLRHGGKSFYQASYGEDDRLSILQVVDNPGRLIPYAACLLASLGLLVHFAGVFFRREERA